MEFVTALCLGIRSFGASYACVYSPREGPPCRPGAHRKGTCLRRVRSGLRSREGSKGSVRPVGSRHWASLRRSFSSTPPPQEVGWPKQCYHLEFWGVGRERGQRGKGVGCLGLSCWPPCLPYGCGYLRRISILKPPFVLGTEKGIVRPEKDLDKIRTVSIQDSV